MAAFDVIILWTYGAYLRILPPAAAGAPLPASLRGAESSIPGASP